MNEIANPRLLWTYFDVPLSTIVEITLVVKRVGTDQTVIPLINNNLSIFAEITIQVYICVYGRWLVIESE